MLSLCQGIEGNPFIIRFKTALYRSYVCATCSIEGNPFIIRFKTGITYLRYQLEPKSIEGNPFIIRFKTHRYF